jgi:tetratricopeptide (TPR) repeat protein
VLRMRFFQFSCCRLPVIFFLAGMVLSGCVTDGRMINPYQAREQREAAQQQDAAGQVVAVPTHRDLLMPALTSINNRIYANEQKLAQWREVTDTLSMIPPVQRNRISACMAELIDILDGYNALHSRLLQQTSLESAQLLAGESLLQLNQRDMEYMESGCDRLLAELRAPTSPPVTESVGVVDPELIEAFDKGEYDRVITLYSQTTGHPGQMIAPQATYLYGQALLKNHQQAEAHTVFTDLLTRVDSPEQGTMAFDLMRVLGDVNFAMGSYDEARRYYADLVSMAAEHQRSEQWGEQQYAALQPGVLQPDERRAYSVLLRNYLAYTPKRDGYAVAEQAEQFLQTYPASRLVPSVNGIHRDIREQVDDWLNRGIKRIESQANERLSRQTHPDPDVVVGEAGPDREIPGVDSYQPAAISLADQEALQAVFDRGKAQLHAKEYDLAIESFTSLLDTPLAEQARPLIHEASQLAAQEDRQKAADLFVRATGAGDLESKTALLLASRQLLQDVLVKYPQSGLHDKVERNLSRIEDELRAIDPSLIETPSAGGMSPIPRSPGATRPQPSANLPAFEY